MKAVVINRFGGPEVFETCEMPRPQAGPGEVVIAVKATSVNPVDWKIRKGSLEVFAADFPIILHGDCAGVIADIGKDVEGFQTGDPVYAFANGLIGKPGALAEYMAADARMVARKPDHLSFEEAAALPLVWATAYMALMDRFTVRPGSKVLIHGGTGGVGSLAVQLAAARLDVEITATCGSEEKCRLAENLGAKKAFNYKTTSVTEMVAEATQGKGFDVIFNTIGQAAINQSVEAAAFGATILDINGVFPTQGPFQFKQLGLISIFAGHPIINDFGQEKVGHCLRDLTLLAEAGKVRPLIDPQRFTFATIGEAHSYQETGNPAGKVVVSAQW